MKFEDKVKMAKICLAISSNFNELASLIIKDAQEDQVRYAKSTESSSECGECLDKNQSKASDIENDSNKDDSENSEEAVDNKSIDNNADSDVVTESENVLAKIIKDNLILDSEADDKKSDVNVDCGDASKDKDDNIGENSGNTEGYSLKEEKEVEEKGKKNGKEFNVPFVDSGDTYVVTHTDKMSKNKYTMRIVVSSASTCKILAGSFIYSEIRGSKIPKNAIKILEMIKTSVKVTPLEDGRVLRIDQDVADVNVATASTLFFGRSESSRVFKNEETGEYYEPTRNKTPQTTSELESYIFNNT